MSLDAQPIVPQRIAVIGGGISGLAAAYLLAPHLWIGAYSYLMC